MAYIKANPGKTNYAVVGSGSAVLLAHWFKSGPSGRDAEGTLRR